LLTPHHRGQRHNYGTTAIRSTTPRPINNESNPPDNHGDSDGPPPLIPDSDDSESDHDSDGAFAHDRDDNCRSSSGPPATTQGISTSPTNFRTLPSQTWSQIMAENHNTHPWTRSQPRPRAHYQDRHEDDYTFDVRMATKDSESTTRNEPDNPTYYWHQPLTPTSFANPKPPTLTSAKIGIWRHTGLHWWYAHIHLAFTTEEISDLETRPPPALRRTIPNIQYMEGNPPQPSRTIHHPISLAPIRPERTRLGHLRRRPSATPAHTLTVPTTAPATNSQQHFIVPQSITEFGIRDNVPNTDGFFFFGIRDIVLDI
jgi:hypothetical protein